MPPKTVSFKTAIKDILSLGSDKGISRDGVTLINDMMNDFLSEQVQAFKNIMKVTGRSTIQSADVLKELARFDDGMMHEKITAIVKKFRKSQGGKEGSPISQSERAGLIFPAGKIRTLVKNEAGLKYRVAQDVGVAMAAAMEYLCKELLQGAFMRAQEVKRSRVAYEHIYHVLEGKKKDGTYRVDPHGIRVQSWFRLAFKGSYVKHPKRTALTKEQKDANKAAYKKRKAEGKGKKSSHK